MLLLKHEVIDQPTRSMDNRAILGLDLQSAFDKVHHSAILRQVSQLNMGQRTFAYIKDFLTNRTTRIVAGDVELPEKTLGSAGTPQGSVISPLLFNLVMIGVAKRLESLENVKHTIYADDITLWTTGGSDGQIETAMQQAIDAVEEQLQTTGLKCSPAKSELLIIPPQGRSKCSREHPNITLRTKEGTTIPQVTSMRVLGMHIDALRHNGITIQKLDIKITKAIRLIRKVANRYAGMKEASLLRLVHSFAVSHVAYVAAYHNWKPTERQKIDAMLRKAYKAALGLYTYTSTEKLLELGVHNTLEEIAEAQRTAQLTRLAQTKTGRTILARIGHSQQGIHASENRASLPRALLRQIRVLPIPKHMHPEVNHDRRLARAKTLTATHATDTGAFYVDAAKYPDQPSAYAATVIAATTGDLQVAGSIQTSSPVQAEELAIALAIANPQCTTVISDSRTALMNYATNQTFPTTVRVCKALQSRTTPVTLKWFPAHAGPLDTGTNRNEEADRMAHALTSRGAPQTSRHTVAPHEEETPITTYSETLEWYRDNRRRYPPPHQELTRKEATVLRQLQAGAIWTPVVAKHICPEVYPTDTCAECKTARATMTHLLWACQAPEDTTAKMPPHLVAAATSNDLYDQRGAVQHVLGILARQQPKAPSRTGRSVTRQLP